MEHKFKVGDRVKHKHVAINRPGTILFLLNSYSGLYSGTYYIVQADRESEHSIWHEEYLSRYEDEPEKPQPKYKVGDVVLAKKIVKTLPDSDGHYRLNSLSTDEDGYHLDGRYTEEKDLRPLRDEPIKPEEVKKGVPVWVKGVIDAPMLRGSGVASITLNKNFLFGLEHFSLDDIKLRHEDE